jgi:hypothetical protein
VEHEPNGWLTYDREVSKLPISFLRNLHRTLFRRGWRLRAPEELVGAPRLLRRKPPAGWTSASFDDGTWHAAPEIWTGDSSKGIATESTEMPFAVRVRLRLERLPSRPLVRFCGSGTLELYVNGTLVKRVHNERSDYVSVADVAVPGDCFREGENLIAATLSSEFPRDNVRLRDEGTRRYALALLEVSE